MADERRRHQRVGLVLPLRVQGYLPSGAVWDEMSATADISSGGASFAVASRDVHLGEVLQLSLAMPKRLRQYDINDATYRIYALVRGVNRRMQPPRVGVMFFGKYPPRGFHDHPTTRFLLPGDTVTTAPVPRGLREGDGRPDGSGRHTAAAPGPDGSGVGLAKPSRPLPLGSSVALDEPVPRFEEGRSERRQGTRLEIFVNFTLHQVDGGGTAVQEELTIADNVGRHGARVLTTLGFKVGDIVLLREAGGENFQTRAEVRGVTRVQPAIDRLHLRFIDREAPDRLLRL